MTASRIFLVERAAGPSGRIPRIVSSNAFVRTKFNFALLNVTAFSQAVAGSAGSAFMRCRQSGKVGSQWRSVKVPPSCVATPGYHSRGAVFNEKKDPAESGISFRKRTGSAGFRSRVAGEFLWRRTHGTAFPGRSSQADGAAVSL